MEWIKTDDLQICRKVKDGVYQLAEFSQTDDDFLFSYDEVITANYKDSDGEWDADAISDIKSCYGSLEEMRELVRKEDEEQIVAEIIFECRSQLDPDVAAMTEEEAEKYLEDIMSGKITLEF